MDFETLKDLAKTVNLNKAKKIEVVGNSSNKKSKLNILYEGLVTDKFKSERDALRFIYKSHDVKHPGYLNLKKRITQQLLTTALFIDVNRPAFNDRAKAYYYAYKNLATASLLILRSSHRPALHILEEILSIAIRYEFTDIAADASRHIRREYVRSTIDIKKNKYFAEINRRYEEKKRYEMLASDYYETLLTYYAVSRSPSERIYKEASAFWEELYPFLKLVDTSSFYYFTYSICIIKYFSMNDIQNALKATDDALDILISRPNTHRSMIVQLLLQKIACCIQLRNKTELDVIQIFNTGFKTVEKFNMNWCRLMELYFYYNAYFLHYEKNLEVYPDVIKNWNNIKIGASYYDNWLLLGGYLHLLAQTGKLDPTQVTEIVGPFRYSKLFNEIEILKKDKEGMNIPLILLPVLYELAQEPSKSNKEIPVDALEKYRQRWLMKDMNKRSNCFFKMIIALAKDDNFSAATQRKINKEYEILKKETPEVSRQNFAIEVIPYEDLWEMLISARFPGESISFTTVKEVNHSLRSIEPPRSSPQL